MEWRPIETAPKDGARVLVFAQLDPPEKWHECMRDLAPLIGIAAYHPDAGWCVCEVREVTHWMPLPDPPAEIAAAAGPDQHNSPPTSSEPAPQESKPSSRSSLPYASEIEMDVALSQFPRLQDVQASASPLPATPSGSPSDATGSE
jgi:hypothetical protein